MTAIYHRVYGFECSHGSRVDVSADVEGKSLAESFGKSITEPLLPAAAVMLKAICSQCSQGTTKVKLVSTYARKQE